MHFIKTESDNVAHIPAQKHPRNPYFDVAATIQAVAYSPNGRLFAMAYTENVSEKHGPFPGRRK